MRFFLTLRTKNWDFFGEIFQIQTQTRPGSKNVDPDPSLVNLFYLPEKIFWPEMKKLEILGEVFPIQTQTKDGWANLEMWENWEKKFQFCKGFFLKIVIDFCVNPRDGPWPEHTFDPQ